MSRPLSAAECISWSADQVVSLNFVMVARVSGNLKETLIRQALDMVQERHFPLRCRIKKGLNPEFAADGVPGIPLRVMERKNDECWIEEAEREMAEPLPWEKGPLVRVLLLTSQNKYELLVTFCHILADATSGVTVVKEILSYIDKLSKGEAVAPGPPLPELPALPELIRNDLKYPPGFLDIIGHLHRVFHKPVELRGNSEVPPDKRITRVIPRILSQNETKKLVKKCKEENTSVHGALCAAMLQAVVEQVRKSQKVPKKGPLLIVCITPVNIRHFFKKPVGEGIGNFISYAIHEQLIDDRSTLWTGARKVKKSIQRQLKFGRHIKFIRNIKDIREQYPDPVDMVRDLSRLNPPVGASNIGRLDIPGQFGNFILEELHFTVVINTAVTNGIATAVTTFGDRLNINFLYTEPYISRERAELMVESTMKRLRDAIRG